MFINSCAFVMITMRHMCRCCFLADNVETCATSNTRMSYSLFAWIPLKFCFDLPVKRCAGDRD